VPFKARRDGPEVHTVKEHALSPSDRAALQSLVPLASAIGVGTMFALFFGSRKRAPYALFEIFAIVAVLIAASLTAATAISLLHRDQAISDHELTQTAMPLVVAAFLLVLVTMLARLRAAGDRTWTLLPVGLVCAWVAAMLTIRVWAATPENASLVASVILGVGALLSFGVAVWERQSGRTKRRKQVALLAKTIGRGYVPDRKTLLPSLPECAGAPAAEVSCWVKRGRTYLDWEGCSRLGALVAERWDSIGKADIQPPTGGRILAAVELRYRIPFRRRHPEARVSTVQVRGGDSDVAAVPMNDDDLIDVTDLGLL
jgi:hypothetical protein